MVPRASLPRRLPVMRLAKPARQRTAVEGTARLLPVRGCNTSPKPVTLAITRDSSFLHFLPYTASHLCYDGRAPKPGDRAPSQGGDGVDFVAVVDQAIALLRQLGRLTYRTLQGQFPVARLPRRMERLGYDGHLEPVAVPVV